MLLHGTTGRPHHLAEVLHPRGRWEADVAGQVGPLQLLLLLLVLVLVIVPIEIWFLVGTSPPLIRGVPIIIIPMILLFLLHHTHVLPLLLE